MISRIALFEGSSFDPHYNLAVEQHLLETVDAGTCVLYLWQNENTVVIGRNQNPWAECRTTLLEEEGGQLARRLSGGGAVFHDLGNLNFTFLVPQGDYDLDRQLGVITEAVRRLGLHAERSGRNDILADGRKFSGNAFYKNGTQAYHHGTLLVEADMEKLGRYLVPSRAKLQSKGVESVRARVVNLRELNPEISIPGLKAALREAFEAVYGLNTQVIRPEELDAEAIAALTARNRSWEWNYGQRLPFSFQCEGRFDWGGVQLAFQVEHGTVQQAKVYSDAMDWALAPRAEALLTGSRFVLGDLQARLAALEPPYAPDLSALLKQNL
ncbi:MAG: lipoate--protein ligase [Oscillospiraceae bacterium]|nr:lipoate--protein ligase [Oscillospiraceae bacterium]